MKVEPNNEALVQALKHVALDGHELSDLQRLYEAPAGVEYATDSADRPGRRIVRRCASIGRRLGKTIGQPLPRSDCVLRSGYSHVADESFFSSCHAPVGVGGRRQNQDVGGGT